MLISNQCGRGQEPVMVQGRILSAVIVSMMVYGCQFSVFQCDEPGTGT